MPTGYGSGVMATNWAYVTNTGTSTTTNVAPGDTLQISGEEAGHMYFTCDGDNEHLEWASSDSSKPPKPSEIPITIELQVGRRMLKIPIMYKGYGEIKITEEDIFKAKLEYIRTRRIHIRREKAEDRAEELLKSFISEIDFRNYKENGYFIVKSGKRVFRIHKNIHERIDVWRKRGGVLVPENRLCVHSPTREVPIADEALMKLMLIRNGSVFERADKGAPYGLGRVKIPRKEEELVECLCAKDTPELISIPMGGV